MFMIISLLVYGNYNIHLQYINFKIQCIEELYYCFIYFLFDHNTEVTPMTLTPQMFLIICPLLFLAGLVDAIGGGGGLISLPAYLLAGVPVHNAIATNKLSSACGTTLTTVRFIRQGLVNWKIAVPTIVFAMLGSSLGANLSMKTDEAVMKNILFLVLPIGAFVVMNPKLFRDNADAEIVLNGKLWVTAILSSFLIGIYDGFYGPGTGTFLIIAFTVFAGLSLRSAHAQAKIINLTTNLTSLTIFLMSGQAIILLGLAAAACNMAGNYVGSSLAMKQSSKVTRPVIIFVLILLFLKVLGVI